MIVVMKREDKCRRKRTVVTSTLKNYLVYEWIQVWLEMRSVPERSEFHPQRVCVLMQSSLVDTIKCERIGDKDNVALSKSYKPH